MPACLQCNARMHGVHERLQRNATQHNTRARATQHTGVSQYIPKPKERVEDLLSDEAEALKPKDEKDPAVVTKEGKGSGLGSGELSVSVRSRGGRVRSECFLGGKKERYGIPVGWRVGVGRRWEKKPWEPPTHQASWGRARKWAR